MAMIGFARVSGAGQDLAGQIERLRAAGCDRIIQGKHSGKRESNAAAIGELMATAEAGDVVVVTKLDRFGRSISQVLTAIEDLAGRGVTLRALDQGVDTSRDDPMSKAMTHLLAMFAEMERNMIVARTQEGKARTGNHGGRRPKLTSKQRAEVKARLAKGESKSALSAFYGVSRSTILTIEKQD